MPSDHLRVPFPWQQYCSYTIGVIILEMRALVYIQNLVKEILFHGLFFSHIFKVIEIN